MKIYIGCDHGAFEAKEEVAKYLKKFGEIIDYGPYTNERCDYPVFAEKVARSVSLAKNDQVKGVLLCGSGIGVSMVANRFRNVRAALCRSEDEVKLARGHNDANILCLGARISKVSDIIKMCDLFFSTGFDQGRHTDRIKIFDNWGEKA